MISRDEYLNVLKRFKDKALIKVITGIRRCGKSTLLEMFQDYLKENGVEESQIISINLEDLEYNFITDYMTLYKYINDKLKEKKKYYKLKNNDIISLDDEKLNELMGDYEKEQMKKDLAVQEAVTLLADAAKVTEVVENKEA